jgi:hypothetical protein
MRATPSWPMHLFLHGILKRIGVGVHLMPMTSWEAAGRQSSHARLRLFSLRGCSNRSFDVSNRPVRGVKGWAGGPNNAVGCSDALVGNPNHPVAGSNGPVSASNHQRGIPNRPVVIQNHTVEVSNRPVVLLNRLVVLPNRLVVSHLGIHAPQRIKQPAPAASIGNRPVVPAGPSRRVPTSSCPPEMTTTLADLSAFPF